MFKQSGDPKSLDKLKEAHQEGDSVDSCASVSGNHPHWQHRHVISHGNRLIAAYNSLTDKHLAGYFSNTRIRRHLHRAGLITRSGRIVPDKEYRHKLFQRTHQRHVRECLAQAIFHKVLEMERLHQIEIKKKLEEFGRRERVHKIKVDRSRRYEEDIIRTMSPRPPTGVRGTRKQHTGPEGEHSESSESLGSSRPNTAPGKMQRPVRLKPIHSSSTTAPLRRSSPYRLLESTNENDQLLNCTMDKSRRRLTTTTTETSNGISPYCLPVINNFVTPVPPATKRKERGVKVTPSATLRGRRLRPTTATCGAADDPAMPRSSVHQSRVCLNMVFFGKTVHLSHDLIDMRDEVKVFQQHCGGENLCVYKGKLLEGETFQFFSRRHRGFPFSLTFFLNGLQVERLSSCCEFKHRKGPRLGGRHGHFGFFSVEGASPCYKCIIAMGLDKKPTPPPKRVKDEGGGGGEESVTSPKDGPEMETGQTGEDAVSHSDCKTTKSVQEKLAEAILKESQRSSEPELSDTSTEEDEEATDKGHGQNDNDVVPEQQQTSVEETKCEESVGEGELHQEETSEPKQQEDETERESHENSDSPKDEIDEDDGMPASEEEKHKSQDTGAALHPESEENKTSESLEDAGAKCSDPDGAPKDVENEEKTAEVEEADSQPDETERGAKSSEADESSVAEPDKKTDETPVSDNAEAMTASTTMEMEAEPPEEREALSCEEAPVTDTEERQRGDSTDTTAASQPEVTAENSSSSLEGSADTTVEKTADMSEDNAKDEGSEDGIREEEAEEASASTKTSKDGNQQEGVGEERREESVEINDEVEREKCAEKRKEAENQTDPDETPEEENSEEKGNNETVKQEEEGDDERRTEEIVENEENVVKETKTESIAARQTNEEPAEKTLDEEDEVAREEKAAKDEDSESVEDKNDEKESEAKEAMNGKTNEGEEINETKADADEEKGEGAGKDDNKDEQSESEKNKDDKEYEEIKTITSKTEEAEKESEVTEESEKMTDGENTSNKNTIESEDVGYGEAADETKTEEMLNNVEESEDAGKDTEGTSSNSKMREIDAENGEISTGAERESHDDEVEASVEDKNDVKTTEHVEDEGKTEAGPTEDDSTEVKEEESGDDTGKHDNDDVDRAPETDVAECEAKQDDDHSGEKHDESAQRVSEQDIEEILETEITEESKPEDLNTCREDGEERKHDENCNKPNINNENRDSDSTQNSDKIIDKVIMASSSDQAQSSTPTDFGLGGTSQKLDESTATSDDNAAADGENGRVDTEEASKASEEGESVLLKPRAQNDEASDAEESVAQVKGTPEALAAEDNTDLVTNWVAVHQMSKYFETFVEPLEDLKQETPRTEVSRSSKEEEAKSSELLRLESPLKVAKMSQNEQMQKDESEKMAAESGLGNRHSEDGPHENDAAKDALQEKEETEVEDFILQTNTEDNDEESTHGRRQGSQGSVEEDKVKGGQTQGDISKTEMESVAGTRLSVVSGKPESVKEKLREASGDEKQTANEETENLLPPSKTEEHDERPASPGGPKGTEEQRGETDEHSREVTEITDFTTSEDGSQAESHSGGIRPQPSAGSVGGERRDVQLIQDIKHTLSKDRLSSLSVDHETTFGRSSYPLLSAARTES
ncbi:putative glutamate-rich protein 3 [Scophthalmus maximus]|uniref:Putative glutamate-rich protein 3 n=1 Tax=Scophthalmus maximus TaxID=52904 RepID=A0A2U9C2Y2_SCOMX|nr:putative glutamate-rich protein 3 [Scophthalmus maximus]